MGYFLCLSFTSLRIFAPLLHPLHIFLILVPARFSPLLPLPFHCGRYFGNLRSFENDCDGNKESSLFFCDPHTPSQKPRVEKNHTLFRDIVPSGSSFDDFSQDTVDLIFSHVNGIARKSLNGKSPYDVFAFTFGASVPAALGIDFVPPSDVIQSPLLLKSAVD